MMNQGFDFSSEDVKDKEVYTFTRGNIGISVLIVEFILIWLLFNTKDTNQTWGEVKLSLGWVRPNAADDTFLGFHQLDDVTLISFPVY